MIGARSAMADDGRKAAATGRVEIGRIANGPTKFNWFKGIRTLSWTNSATKSGRSDLGQRWKRR